MQLFEKRVRSTEHDKFKKNREYQSELWSDYQTAQRQQTEYELASGKFTMYGEDPNTGEPIEYIVNIEEADESAPGGGHNRQLMRDLLEKARKHSDRRSNFNAPEPRAYMNILHYDEERAYRFKQ
jgi:hypothetical protein